MAAAQQGGGGGQQDNSYAMLWWIAALFGLLGGLWYAFSSEIILIYLSFKLYEIQIIKSVWLVFSNNTQTLDQVQSALQAAIVNIKMVQFRDLMTLGNQVGNLIHIPLALILIVLAVVVYLTNATRSYRRTYDMKTFMKLEQENWPQISPVVDLNLLKENIDIGPWAMAMTPMQFCKKNKLLDEVMIKRTGGFGASSRPRLDVVLKRGEANNIFTMQLGPLWKGVDALPPHVKALFAAFAARINADTKPAEQLFRQLAESSQTKLNYAGVDELIKKHLNTKLVKEIVSSHAYVYTVMASMLQAAREDGVQASADFLWLKPIDRRLWYTLNTVGRQTPFIEVAGIFAHWIAENAAGRKLLVPMIEQATNAVQIALKEVVYKPDEEPTKKS